MISTIYRRKTENQYIKYLTLNLKSSILPFMIKPDLELPPIGATELTERVLIQTEDVVKSKLPFLRDKVADGNGAYSLYGQILHAREVPDALLVNMSDEESRNLALAGVSLGTNYRKSLVDYGWQNTSHTRPDLVIGRFAASMVSPRLILGPNAELVITLGEMADNMSSEKKPRLKRARNQSTLADVIAYCRIVGGGNRGGGVILEEDSKPIWYAHHPIKLRYEQFGDDVARIMALTANEVQLLPELPLDPENNRSRVSMAIGELTVTFAEHIKQLHFMHKLVIPNGNGREQPLTLAYLIRATNERLRHQEMINFSTPIPAVWIPKPSPRR